MCVKTTINVLRLKKLIARAIKEINRLTALIKMTLGTIINFCNYH